MNKLMYSFILFSANKSIKIIRFIVFNQNSYKAWDLAYNKQRNSVSFHFYSNFCHQNDK